LSDYPLAGPDGNALNLKLNATIDVLTRHSYWRLLANWGPCSVACDGGIATR
jgi:hypothetical protein